MKENKPDVAVPDKIEECAKREIPMLREELHNLKKCQIAFLTTAFTATGLLLGFTSKLENPLHVCLGMLAPLVIVLPASCFFFDKARTITRIVGYFRVLEDILNDSNFPGWETALSEFREKDDAIDPSLREIITMQKPHFQYWSMAFYTFVFLTIFPGALSVVFAVSAEWPSILHWIACYAVLCVASVLAVLCIIRNGRLISALLRGENSYHANYKKWCEILGRQTRESRKEKHKEPNNPANRSQPIHSKTSHITTQT